ncbi:Glycosyltransferase [Heracleum sosnowskyi]|uniref:Glycosyltransferase n=1 Tax=Heracleum sosnowskyi TaxID=360622 RepID=A0AAD8JDT6_9APIA|nr:Glycosyltransferase [Heracleum sosnowskyi]
MAVTSQESSKPLEIIVIPYITPGHLVPLSEIGCLFASRQEQVIIITTTDKAPVVENTIKQCKSSGHSISVHAIPFPYKEVGLPEGFSLEHAKDMESATKYYHGLGLMQSAMQDFMRTRRPDCIIADKFFPWTSDFAETLNIPRIVFDPCFMFRKALQEALLNPNSPHLTVKSDYEPFVVTDLPHPITVTRSKLPANNYAMLLKLQREAELKSYGVVINSMSELELEYSEYYANKLGCKVFHVGPASLIHENVDSKVDRSHNSVVSKDQVLSWLDSKNPNSVLYISFGSVCELSDEQLMEIACALESTNCDFIWVVRGKTDNDDDSTWQPKEFNKQGKGLILKGWAPQLLILQHPSAGGFLTHCGSNSVLEAVIEGVPLVTWPLIADQFSNEMLVTQVLGIGVEVGVGDWRFFSDLDRKIIKREKIEKAVRMLMDGGDHVEEIRKKTKELGEKAVRAVKTGGSSHQNLTNLIRELKQLRDNRVEQ